MIHHANYNAATGSCSEWKKRSHYCAPIRSASPVYGCHEVVFVISSIAYIVSWKRGTVPWRPRWKACSAAKACSEGHNTTQAICGSVFAAAAAIASATAVVVGRRQTGIESSTPVASSPSVQERHQCDICIESKESKNCWRGVEKQTTKETKNKGRYIAVCFIYYFMRLSIFFQ